MNIDEDKWMENIFHSMEGSQRAKAPSNLFAKIEGQIASSNIKVVPRQTLRYAAIAASLILILNVGVIFIHHQKHKTQEMSKVPQNSDHNTLISSFPIYK